MNLQDDHFGGMSRQSMSVLSRDIEGGTSASIFIPCMAFALMASITVAIFGYLLQKNTDSLYQFGVSGLLVPDAIALRETTNFFWELLSPLDARWRPNIGVVSLYGVGVFGGEVAVCGLNVVLILGAAYYFYKTLAAFIAEQRRLLLTFVFIISCVVGNIYIIEVMAFPNKEIPLMLITNAYIYFLAVRNNYIAAGALSLFALAFRDGYGLILFCSLGVIWFLNGRSIRTQLLLIVAIIALFTFVPISSLSAVNGAVARNVQVGDALLHSSGVSFGYLWRLLYTVFSLEILSSFVTDGRKLYLLSIGYWQLGVFIMAGAFWAFWQLLHSEKKMERNIALTIIISVLCISYGTYIQPRYLMPQYFYLVFGFLRYMRLQVVTVSVSIAMPIILVFMGTMNTIPDLGSDAIDNLTFPEKSSPHKKVDSQFYLDERMMNILKE